MSAQRILGVSLTTAERIGLSAAYDGSTLVLGKIETFDGGLLQWRSMAAGRVRAAMQGGAAVFVEEMGDAVSQYAHGILLSDTHPIDNRPMLSVALDWYFAMLNAGAIIFAPGTERSRIMESAVDMSSDDRGRNVYRVDWSRVKGAHRAMLLCCLAAEGLQPISDGYLEQMFGGLSGPEGPPANPLERITQSMREWDIEREREQQEWQRKQREAEGRA